MLWGPLGKHVHGLMFLAGKKKVSVRRTKESGQNLQCFVFLRYF